MGKNGSLVKNSVFNVIYKLLNLAFPLIMSIYGAHIIYSSGIGKVASAQNVVQYFVLAASLGIPQYGIREIANRREQSKEKNIVFSELFFLNLISTFFCVIAFLIFASLKGWFGDKRLYLISGILIVLNIINVDWLYQGEEDYVFITLRSAIVKICSLLVMFFTVKAERDYCNYALINIIAIAGNNVFNILHLKKIGVILQLKGLNIVRHLKPVFLLLCTTVSIELYTLLDTTMITYFCEDENVGFYTAAIKIPKMIIVVVTGISGVLLPRLTIYYNNGNKEKCNEIINKILSILLFLFMPCGVGLFVVAPQLVSVFFGETFLPGIVTLKIASFLIYALGFSNLFGTQLLLTVRKEKLLLISTICGAGTNIIMNLILIPIFYQNGAAFASVVSECIVTIISFVFASKYFKIRVEKRVFFTSLLATLAMFVACYFVTKIQISDFVSLILTCLTGAVVYALINIVFKNPILIFFKNMKRAS